MGQKSSVLKVTSRISVIGGCGTVDAIRLSYGRRSCCRPKRRVVASFSFPREKWVQPSPQGMLQNSSAEVAKVNVGELRKKDGDTPVRVCCLAGGISVFRAEMRMADLLEMFKYTEERDKAVLLFSLAGGRLEGTGKEGHAFTVMFCNGKRFANGGTAQPLVPPQKHHQPDHKNEPDNGPMKEVAYDHVVNSHGSQEIPLSQDHGEKEQVMEEVVGEKRPSLDVECQTEEKDLVGEEHPLLDEENEIEKEESMGEGDPSLTMEWIQEQEKQQKVRHRRNRSRKTSPARTKNKNISRGQDSLQAVLWDLVADCAEVLSLGLVLYHAWLEYSAYQ